MPERYLVVDGHSVIFSWPDLRQLHQQRAAAARDALTQALQRLHDCSAWRVTVVFDGKSGSPAPHTPGDLVVAYSKKDQTADAVIETLVGSLRDAEAVLVVTADEMERRTVEAHGAQTASPDWLRAELEQQQIQWGERLHQVHRRARW